MLKTLCRAAVEVLTHGKYSKSSDVWSFGVGEIILRHLLTLSVLWEIFELGKIPYTEMDNPTVIAKVTAGYKLPRPEMCPDKIYNLMTRCLDSNVSVLAYLCLLFDHLIFLLTLASHWYGLLSTRSTVYSKVL